MIRGVRDVISGLKAWKEPGFSDTLIDRFCSRVDIQEFLGIDYN